MKSFDRNFLEQQAVPIEMAGTLRALGEYRGKQELFTRQTPQVLETLRQVAIIQSTESSQKWHEGRHRLLPWWQFSLGILLTAYKEFEDRVGVVRASRGAKTTWVREAVQHLPATFGIGELARACPGVSRPMIRVILEKLRDEGKLEVLGTGRGAMWRKRR